MPMHFIEMCMQCGEMVRQCRCTDTEKEVRHVICEKCLAMPVDEKKHHISHIPSGGCIVFCSEKNDTIPLAALAHFCPMCGKKL